jgi:hypothetical protein
VAAPRAITPARPPPARLDHESYRQDRAGHAPARRGHAVKLLRSRGYRVLIKTLNPLLYWPPARRPRRLLLQEPTAEGLKKAHRQGARLKR